MVLRHHLRGSGVHLACWGVLRCRGGLLLYELLRRLAGLRLALHRCACRGSGPRLLIGWLLPAPLSRCTRWRGGRLELLLLLHRLLCLELLLLDRCLLRLELLGWLRLELLLLLNCTAVGPRLLDWCACRGLAGEATLRLTAKATSRSAEAARRGTEATGCRGATLHLFIDVLVLLDFVLVFILAGAVFADSHFHLHWLAMQFFRAADLQLADSVAQGGQLLVRDFLRGRVRVLDVEVGEQFAACILAVQDVEATFQVRAVACLGWVDGAFVHCHVIPACRNGLYAGVGCYVCCVKIELCHGFKLLRFWK